MQDIVTKEQLQELAKYTVCPPHKIELEALAEEKAYNSNVVAGKITMLELLEKYPACQLPFEKFLELLTPLKVH